MPPPWKRLIITSWTRLTSPPTLKVWRPLVVEKTSVNCAVFIGLSDTGKSVRHAEGNSTRRDAWAGGVGACSFKVTTILEVDLVDGRFADLGCEARHQETLVVAGRTVGGGGAVGERRRRAIAIGTVEVHE